MMRRVLRERRGAVAVLFALSLLPITLAVALAVDYSFYIEAQAQLNLAADAAALHAVRVASSAYANSGGTTTTAAAQAAGVTSGQQWFAAQVGTIGSATISPANVAVNVTYSASPPGFTATVSYSGTVSTHFGKFIVSAWNISNTSTAVVQSAYVEFVMLLDNSSSMLLGATVADMLKMERLTPCSTESANEGLAMNNYSWAYPPGVGYPGYNFSLTNQQATGQALHYTLPLTTVIQGACDKNYDGDPSLCFYLPQQTLLGTGPNPSQINPTTGYCTPSGGAAASSTEPVNTPQAPCAFACHNMPTDATGYSPDYYGLAKNNNVQLRFDVVHTAANQIIQTLMTTRQSANQYSVGIYEFNKNLQTDYPPTGSGEAGTDLVAAQASIQNIQPPLTDDNPNTYFQASATALATVLTLAGDGSSAATPYKNLFIVTDGLSDITGSQGQVLGTITSATNEQICQMFKDKGFTVYVLYTQYLPIPTNSYLNPTTPLTYAMQYAEPSNNSLITQALTACASSPSTFFPASDAASITTAMNNMLSAALNAAGRISK
jgi:Flp pilus assembly protein TadG